MSAVEPAAERSIFTIAEAAQPGVRERLEAARGLVRAVRRLMRAAATTAVDPAAIGAVEREVDALAERLERRTRTRALRVALDGSVASAVRAGESWEHFAFNPLGIPLLMRLDGEVIRARLDLSALHEGPPGLMHGGFSAALMDALLGTLVQVHGIIAVTAGLELRYRHGVPLDHTVELAGRIESREGRKVWTEGWIEHEGRRCVEASGLFVAVDRDPG